MADPRIIKGGLAIDDRGLLRFVNDFDFSDVKRFYQVENYDISIIRAFHGHLHEEKYVYVASGSALIILVKLDNVESPSKKSELLKYVLSSDSPSILHIPAGYANGFKILRNDTRMIFYSTKSLKDSEEHDDYRYPYNYWGDDIWKIENR
jgi:dTDP-4-dehydrorhamnose 3,5-epimerase-like enzyme